MYECAQQQPVSISISVLFSVTNNDRAGARNNMWLDILLTQRCQVTPVLHSTTCGGRFQKNFFAC